MTVWLKYTGTQPIRMHDGRQVKNGDVVPLNGADEDEQASALIARGSFEMSSRPVPPLDAPVDVDAADDGS